MRRKRETIEAFALAAIAASGLLAATPPLQWWPLALCSAGALYRLCLLDGRTAVFAAWLAGLAQSLVGERWAIEVMGSFAGVGLAGSLAGLVAVSAYQASVPALATWACQRARAANVTPLLAAPLCFALASAIVPFVFPWSLAIAIAPAWPLAQVAELGGPPAVTALLVLLGALVVEGGGAAWQRRPLARDAKVALAMACALVTIGLARAAQVARWRQAAEPVRTALVQSNIGVMSMAEREKQGAELIARLRAATEAAGEAGAALVVWPESAYPFAFDRAASRVFAEGHPWDVRGRYRGRLLFGALTHPFGEAHVYNSAVLVRADGALAGIYDKSRLVMFGEYVPFADRFPAWAAKVRARTPSWPTIEPGAAPRALADEDLRIGALICYEDLFADHVAKLARDSSPQLLVTLANHAWFGASAAPAQALALASLRAIETRRDLLRATTTGVTSFTDALGRVRAEGPPRRADAPAELVLVDARPLGGFALGPWAVPAFPWLCAALLFAAWWRARRRRRAPAPSP